MFLISVSVSKCIIVITKCSYAFLGGYRGSSAEPETFHGGEINTSSVHVRQHTCKYTSSYVALTRFGCRSQTRNIARSFGDYFYGYFILLCTPLFSVFSLHLLKKQDLMRLLSSRNRCSAASLNLPPIVHPNPHYYY